MRYEDLSSEEKKIFDLTPKIRDLVNGSKDLNVYISNKIRKNEYDDRIAGVYIRSEQRIIIRRDQLKSLRSYCATLLHEYAHHSSQASDYTIQFELELSKYLGVLGVQLLGIMLK